MPHPGTHVTIVQRLALANPRFAAVLGSPDPNIGQTSAEAVRRMRFASLGAVSPDLFYFLADYGSLLQGFEDRIVSWREPSRSSRTSGRSSAKSRISSTKGPRSSTRTSGDAGTSTRRATIRIPAR